MKILSGMDGLPALRDYRSFRVSSYDRTGANADFVLIKPGEKKTTAEIKGAGSVRHIWFGGAAQEEGWVRKTILRVFWDGEKDPSVECPFGDFFGVGHGMSGNYWSLPLSMRVADWQNGPAMNC